MRSYFRSIDALHGAPCHSGAPERDPVVLAYLTFLERDMKEHPERLQPFTEADLARVEALTKDVVVSDDDVIPHDVSL
jgi:antitoxin PrlF